MKTAVKHYPSIKEEDGDAFVRMSAVIVFGANGRSPIRKNISARLAVWPLKQDQTASTAPTVVILTTASEVLDMNESWKQEADYQLTDGILSALLKKGFLTVSEYRRCVREIREEIKPPVTLLCSDQKVLNSWIRTR